MQRKRQWGQDTARKRRCSNEMQINSYSTRYATRQQKKRKDQQRKRRRTNS